MEIVFKHLIASRGWHVYGKTVRPNPKKGQRLYGQRERDADALLIDQYAVAWMMMSKEKLVADVVGHVPQEISRFVYFFPALFPSTDATVENERYRPSPIAKGGLEIVLRATFNIEDSKRFLLLRLKELIQKNYELLDLSPRSPTAIDEERHASDNEEDLSIVMIDDDDEDEED